MFPVLPLFPVLPRLPDPLDPVRPLDPLVPPTFEPPVVPDPVRELPPVCDPLPERDPAPELLDPLMPPAPLELPDDPDEPWSFLFRLFGIRPPALSGALISQQQLCGAKPPLINGIGNIQAISCPQTCAITR